MTLAESINAFAAEIVKRGATPQTAYVYDYGVINSILQRGGENKLNTKMRNAAREMLANAIADFIEQGEK